MQPSPGGGYWQWPIPHPLEEMLMAWMERLRRAGLLSPLLSGPGGEGRTDEEWRGERKPVDESGERPPT